MFACLAVEVTWEDQQRGLNGSLSDGGTQPNSSLAGAGWLVWMWNSDTFTLKEYSDHESMNDKTQSGHCKLDLLICGVQCPLGVLLS